MSLKDETIEFHSECWIFRIFKEVWSIKMDHLGGESEKDKRAAVSNIMTYNVLSKMTSGIIQALFA